MTREQEILIHLIQALVRDVEPIRIRNADSVDWPGLAALLRQHRVMATLGPYLHRTGAPEHIGRQAEEESHRLRLRAAFLLLEAARFLPALEEAGARPLLLRGAALDQTCYGVHSRFFADLDILADQEKLAVVFDILRTFGYEFQDPSLPPLYYERHQYRRILKNPAGVMLQIYWDLSRPSAIYNADLEGIRDRAREITVTGASFRIPADPDHLLCSAGQAQREGFLDLRRIIDAALLVKTGNALDENIVSNAALQGLTSPLWILLRLAQTITRVEVPVDLMSRLRPSPRRLRCLGKMRLPQKLLAGRSTAMPDHHVLVHLLCAPTRKSSAGLLHRFLFPGEAYFIEHGYPPGSKPGSGIRTFLTVRQAYRALRLTARLVSYLIPLSGTKTSDSIL